MAARRTTKKAKSEAASKLAEALNFVAPANVEGEEPYKAHCRVAGKMITATNGLFTAGHAIEEEFALCPHTGRLIDALNRAGTTLALTENENGTLLVKGDKIRATVPCLAGDQIPQIMPDANVAAIDDRIKEGFGKLLPLIDYEGDRVIEVSVLLQANSMFATNGCIIFEHWHGIDLPPGLVIPKTFAKAVAATTKKLTGFGFSAKSVTFYFEDGSWYKTQVYEEPWPNVDHLFDFPTFFAPVPEGLWEAVKAIESFSKDGAVHFHEEKLKTTYDNYQDRGGPLYGATYDVPGLQGGHTFTANLLRVIEPVCLQIDYTSNDDRAFFCDGGNIRGSIMKCRAKTTEPVPDRAIAAAWTMPETTTGAEVAQAFAGVQAGAWGPPADDAGQEEPEAPAVDPANPWAGIVTGASDGWGAPSGRGCGTTFVDIEDDDIPF